MWEATINLFKGNKFIISKIREKPSISGDIFALPTLS